MLKIIFINGANLMKDILLIAREMFEATTTAFRAAD